jgi:hypothetical protein
MSTQLRSLAGRVVAITGGAAPPPTESGLGRTASSQQAAARDRHLRDAAAQGARPNGPFRGMGPGVHRDRDPAAGGPDFYVFFRLEPV